MTHQITEIQIIPIKPKNGIVAFTSFVLDGVLYLSSIAIMTRPDGGHRLVFPTKKIGDRSINIFHPINKEFSETIKKEVMKKFEEVTAPNDRHDCPDAET